MVDKWLKPQEVSDLLGVKINTLQLWRQKNKFPELKFVKLGTGVRYLRTAVEDFMKSRNA